MKKLKKKTPKINYEKFIKDFYKHFFSGYCSSLDFLHYKQTGKARYRDSVMVLKQSVDFTGDEKAEKLLKKMFYITYPRLRNRR